MRLAAIFWNALWLRCPACGRGRLFARGFRMAQRCSHCGRDFRRGPGFYLGSIYVNYGLTALLLVVAYFGLFFVEATSPRVLPTFLTPAAPQLRWILLAFTILFPLAFFRHARSFWLAFDEYFDPAPREEI
jgi:uncharacterized protein (DUF983 family)